ncbi:MAG: T9SS type A sorting domain-containing protein [Saprospiraceae bacterium]|nr:T9SS type A sorting domain-containing protein [Saprospiraceae bacterium]
MPTLSKKPNIKKINPGFKTIIFFIFLFPVILFGKTLEVGPGKPYSSPAAAKNFVLPGDTILIFPNVYPGGNFIDNLHGEADKYIYFIGVNVESVIFQGNSQAFHFSDVSYLRIENISITGQTGNGMNIDDGGTFDTPSHHIHLKNCRFFDMAAQGNNDLLKLSGLDQFIIEKCTFVNGASGGSGADMVGCHYGTFTENRFENMGSNCIQAKGGTQFITITKNWFVNGGQRTLNLGGSTGLAFFRPLDAPFEAADIDVFANVIVGSWAPIAFVGCVRVHVVNNTIINPQNWIIRILQETVDTGRFLPCGQNSFVNNIIYYSNSLSRHVNIGPNTEPTSFTFEHNLWYNTDNPSNSKPDLPVQEVMQIEGKDPLFSDVDQQDFTLTSQSPAIDAGKTTPYPFDFSGNPLPQGISFDIGAFEFFNVSSYLSTPDNEEFLAFPNPFENILYIKNNLETPQSLHITDITGQFMYVNKTIAANSVSEVMLDDLTSGIYVVCVGNRTKTVFKK